MCVSFTLYIIVGDLVKFVMVDFQGNEIQKKKKKEEI